MHLIKILKRNDSASVIVAILIGFMLLPVLSILTGDLSNYLAGVTDKATLEWRESIIAPLIGFMLQIILLEAILRVVIYIRPLFVRRSSDVRSKK